MSCSTVSGTEQPHRCQNMGEEGRLASSGRAQKSRKQGSGREGCWKVGVLRNEIRVSMCFLQGDLWKEHLKHLRYLAAG